MLQAQLEYILPSSISCKLQGLPTPQKVRNKITEIFPGTILFGCTVETFLRKNVNVYFSSSDEGSTISNLNPDSLSIDAA